MEPNFERNYSIGSTQSQLLFLRVLVSQGVAIMSTQADFRNMLAAVPMEGRMGLPKPSRSNQDRLAEQSKKAPKSRQRQHFKHKTRPSRTDSDHKEEAYRDRAAERRDAAVTAETGSTSVSVLNSGVS